MPDLVMELWNRRRKGDIVGALKIRFKERQEIPALLAQGSLHYIYSDLYIRDECNEFRMSFIANCVKYLI